LTGLVGRILEGKPHLATATDGKGTGAGVRAFLLALARLGAAGVPLDLAALFDGREHDPRPPKGKLDIPVGGANLGKPARPAPAPVAARPAAATGAGAAAPAGSGAASGGALTSAKAAPSATMA